MSFATLRTGYARVFGFFQWFNVFAFWIIRATNEFFTCTAVFEHQLTAAFRAFAPFQFSLCSSILCHTFSSLLGSFVSIACVIAVGITCTSNKTSCASKFNLQFVVTAFWTSFVQFLRGEFGSFNTFFFNNLLVKSFPEFFHHRNPLALAIGDFV